VHRYKSVVNIRSGWLLLLLLYAERILICFRPIINQAYTKGNSYSLIFT